MAGYPSRVRRVLRTAPWSRNRLMRRSDRIEGVIRLFVLLVLVAAIPIGVGCGSAAAAHAAARIAAQNSGKSAVTATIAADPIVLPVDQRVPVVQPATTVTWTANGHPNTATIDVPTGAKKDDTLRIWVDPSGRQTWPPRSVHDARTHGIEIGMLILAAICTGALILFRAAEWLLARRRSAAWDRDWSRVIRRRTTDW
ncbi:hypothetical protein ACIP5Y_26715 [Nocardia sp. NPDC088792]|uniref:Rv1733c family protein n=1 Tax=Nocardia sp. NPDC088792 TaxID=3364332 RepID=UPI003819E875